MLMLQSCESANLCSFPGQASWEALSAKKNIVSSIILWSGQQSCFQERDSLYSSLKKEFFVIIIEYVAFEVFFVLRFGIFYEFYDK